MYIKIKILCLVGCLAFWGIVCPDSAWAAETAATENASWFEQVQTTGSKVWKNVKERAPDLWDKTKDKASEVYDKAKEKAPEVAAKAKDGLAKVQEKASDFLQSQEDEFWERTERQIYGDNAVSEADTTPALTIPAEAAETADRAISDLSAEETATPNEAAMNLPTEEPIAESDMVKTQDSASADKVANATDVAEVPTEEAITSDSQDDSVEESDWRHRLRMLAICVAITLLIMMVILCTTANVIMWCCKRKRR